MIGLIPKTIVGVLDPYHEDAITLLREQSNLEVLVPAIDGNEKIYELAEAVLVRSETHLGTTEFERFKKLRYIAKQGVGVDNIDLKAAAKSGVQVYNTPGLNSETVAELSLTLALCLSRRVCEIDRAVRDGKTVIRSQTLGNSLFGKVLGIVGMGNIGYALAKKWVGAMEGDVIAFDPYYSGKPWSTLLGKGARQVSDLAELLENTDVISLHVPLNKSTSKLISRAEFARMKQGCILLNCARGGIVDEEALLDALSSGHLRGAGLDAMEIEPPTRKTYGAFLQQENVIMTPHIGASTAENQSRSGVAVAKVVVDLINGQEVDNRLV